MQHLKPDYFSQVFNSLILWVLRPKTASGSVTLAPARPPPVLSSRAMNAALNHKYRQTDYIVDDDPPLRLKIDEQNDGARILLASFNVEAAAFLTAWNPGSEPLPVEDNYDRQSDLLADIEALRLNYFVGRGEDPVSGWTEDSYLVLGIQPEQALELAKKYGQNAYVWVPNSGVPALVWTTDTPDTDR